MNWKKLLLNLAVGYASKEIPAVGKIANAYQKYGDKYVKPLKQGVKDYERMRDAGRSKEESITMALTNNQLSRSMLLDVLSHVSNEFGEVAVSDVLEGTMYGSKPKKK